jgi:HEAT repeat protein
MNAQPAFQKIIDELIHGGKTLSRQSLQHFSDIDPAALKALLAAWPRIGPERKRLLLSELQALADRDTLVSFDDLARALLADDSDSQVRAGAIRLLEECDDLKLVPTFLRLMADDESAETRAEAAAALGKFVQLGELEKIPIQVQRQVEEALLTKAASDDQPSVRREALESLGYSARPEAVTLIQSAFGRQDPEWQVSALHAMARSSDERWAEDVLSRMQDEDGRVQLAAVEAAGELGLKAAQTVLLRVLEVEEDDELTSAAIWSLSQVGGEDARVFIENLLDQTEDEDQIEFLEQALDNLSFTEDFNRFDLMTYDPDEEE